MNLRFVHANAGFLGLLIALQLAMPATAQEAGGKGEPEQPVSTTPAGAPPADEPQIDAPSATLRGEQGTANQPPPAQQTQQSFPMKVEGGKDPGAGHHIVQQPQGAAAARVQPTTGTAASRPAGAAIAPVKQRRVRSFLIRFGALAGAGIAIGTVFALSSASPSRPPGSH